VDVTNNVLLARLYGETSVLRRKFVVHCVHSVITYDPRITVVNWLDPYNIVLICQMPEASIMGVGGPGPPMFYLEGPNC